MNLIFQHIVRSIPSSTKTIVWPLTNTQRFLFPPWERINFSNTTVLLLKENLIIYRKQVTGTTPQIPTTSHIQYGQMYMSLFLTIYHSFIKTSRTSGIEYNQKKKSQCHNAYLRLHFTHKRIQFTSLELVFKIHGKISFI